MSGKELRSEHLQELLPNNIITSREHRAQSGRPPDICAILKSKSGQGNLVLLRTTNGTKDFLCLPYPSFCNVWRTLPSEGRRSHPPEPLHHRSSMRPPQICQALLMSCRGGCRQNLLHLSLESCLGLGLKLKGLHQTRKSLKKAPELWWWW